MTQTLDDIVAIATRANVRLAVPSEHSIGEIKHGSDALFHEPLLALTILIIAHYRRPGIPNVDLSAWVLGTLVKRSEALRLMKARLGWSVALKRRCADALVTLEDMQLASVSSGTDRIVRATPGGHGLIRGLVQKPNELGTLVRDIERAYKALELTGLLLL